MLIQWELNKTKLKLFSFLWLIQVDQWIDFQNRPQDFFLFYVLNFIEYETTALPGLLVIQIQIQAMCFTQQLV